MANTSVAGFLNVEETHVREGTKAADLIWHDNSDAQAISDPRVPAFAGAVIDGLAHALASAPGVLHRVMTGAASAAEDLNVEPFQGLVEVIQNADDLGATEVRFALRESQRIRQLLVVHNGRPVVCQHVLAMALPYLTTKTEDPNQKGRFGIGLKTLARISTRMSVYSKPYYFTAERLSIRRIEPELPIDRFYNPLKDTLIVLDLVPLFQDDALRQWFESWDEDGLLFLNSVSSFRWCDLAGQTVSHKAVVVSEWAPAAFEHKHEEIAVIRQRVVRGTSATWTIFSADVRVRPQLKRAHKAKSDFATVSIAVPEQSVETGIFVAFKTRVPTNLAVSIDAQFDPSTAREELIDNAWNAWLIERAADLIADVACGLLATEPRAAWRMIPLLEEQVGTAVTRWPLFAFSNAFQRVRDEIGARAVIRVGEELVAVSETAYEDTTLSGLLDVADVELLAAPRKGIPLGLRDDEGRWRKALDQICVSEVVSTAELLSGFSKTLFLEKPPAWWVAAADRITTHHPAPGIFGVPFWLTIDCRAVSCHPAGKTDRPLVFGDFVSHFASKWKLLDRLHKAYGNTPDGERVRDWLVQHAAFTITPDPEIELAAFAESFGNLPMPIDDEDLRELRDRFDVLPDRRAEELGCRVGAALLLDGFSFKNGKKRPAKVSPVQAYLPRTLDSEHPYWPEAASTLPDIVWLSANYNEKLKTGAARTSRRRADGSGSRGPRKFLMLLGAECAPRLAELGRHYGGGQTRQEQLQQKGAELVEQDYHSPDMERVLDALPRLSKKERRSRSAALLKVLSHYWDRVYANKVLVPAFHQARVHIYNNGSVTAAWLCKLREAAWVAVGKGDLVSPANAVIRTALTESLYSNNLFVCDLEEADVERDLASELKLIMAVRISDLVAHLEEIRDGSEEVEHDHLLQIYRTMAKFCPKDAGMPVGNLRSHELRQRFSSGKGLISLKQGEWKRPEDLFSGKDIFHRPELFVPGGPAYSDLWRVLNVQPPSLTDCIRRCRQLAEMDHGSATEAALIDLYRYLEPLLAQTDRRQKDRIRTLPLFCFGKWVSTRPIYYIEDRELRAELARTLRVQHFWTPPCDVTDLPKLTATLGLIRLNPVLTVVGNRQQAMEAGENMRSAFRQSVDQLSNELARNDASTREQLALTWDELRDAPLFLYDQPFDADVREPNLGAETIRVKMKALLSQAPLELHVWSDALHQRDNCGRAIASLFPPKSQWRIENAWVASWIASKEADDVGRMRFASDEEHAEALAELARKVEGGKKGNVKVTPPASRTTAAKPRILKSFQGHVSGVVVHEGSSPAPPPSSQSKTLADRPLPPSPPSSGALGAAPVDYSTADLEQRGWEYLTHALNTNDGPELVDFRKRHRVGADGVIDWKTFVELKATGKGLQSSIEMSNSEFERAKERGLDFILALVSGLEEGQRTEVRLILDPANRAAVRPIHGIRLVGLAEAPAVIIPFDDENNG